MLEMDLNTMQQRAELQEAHLQVLREQKLAEVQQATYVKLNIVFCVVKQSSCGMLQY